MNGDGGSVGVVSKFAKSPIMSKVKVFRPWLEIVDELVRFELLERFDAVREAIEAVAVNPFVPS